MNDVRASSLEDVANKSEEKKKELGSKQGGLNGSNGIGSGNAGPNKFGSKPILSAEDNKNDKEIPTTPTLARQNSVPNMAMVSHDTLLSQQGQQQGQQQYQPSQQYPRQQQPQQLPPPTPDNVDINNNSNNNTNLLNASLNRNQRTPNAVGLNSTSPSMTRANQPTIRNGGSNDTRSDISRTGGSNPTSKSISSTGENMENLEGTVGLSQHQPQYQQQYQQQYQEQQTQIQPLLTVNTAGIASKTAELLKGKRPLADLDIHSRSAVSKLSSLLDSINPYLVEEGPDGIRRNSGSRGGSFSGEIGRKSILNPLYGGGSEGGGLVQGGGGRGMNDNSSHRLGAVLKDISEILLKYQDEAEQSPRGSTTSVHASGIINDEQLATSIELVGILANSLKPESPMVSSQYEKILNRLEGAMEEGKATLEAIALDESGKSSKTSTTGSEYNPDHDLRKIAIIQSSIDSTYTALTGVVNMLLEPNNGTPK